jgi:hypothetical protein
MANDVFNKKLVNPKKPVTADMALINWDGILAQATTISWQYGQSVTRRYTLGSNGQNTAVIYPGRPQGALTMQRLIAEGTDNIFGKPGWDICKGLGTITIALDGTSAYDGCTVKGGTYTFRGCTVTGYSISLNSEDLTVADNVSIEFLQMEYQPPA